MMQQTIFIIKSKQERTDNSRATAITKSSDYAIGCADLFYLHRGRAFARGICSVQALRDNPIEVATGFFKPPVASSIAGCRRRKAQSLRRFEIRACEFFEKGSAFSQDTLHIHP